VLLLPLPVPQSSDVEKEVNISLCLGWIKRKIAFSHTVDNRIIKFKLTLSTNPKL